MFKRFAAAASMFLLLSLVAGCGGGGGGDGDVSVRPNVTSLQFSGIAGESIASQNIDVELTNASGTVYGAVEVADSSVAGASFNITGGTTAVIHVSPSGNLTPGTYRTTVLLRIYRNPNGTDLLSTFSYPITVTVLPGLSVNPTALALNAFQGQAVQASLAVTVPQGSTGPVTAVVSPAHGVAPWLGLTVVANNVQVSASAASLQPGVYPTEIEIRVPRPNGSVAVRVPLTFTVGVGVVAPANQTLALNRNTTVASLGGTVNVARADGAVSTFTATSSEGWLRLPSASGSTPGSLSFAVDPMQVQFLPQFADSTATVTIAIPGLNHVSFTVTLQKRLPYVAAAGPYGMPFGAPARIVVGGVGFSQLANPMTQLLMSGLNVSSVDVLSDTQLAVNAVPVSGGPFTIGVTNTAGIPTPSALVRFSEPFGYAPDTVPHVGGKNVYLHDPVRRAVFALSRSGNALVRYQFANNAWTVASRPHINPLNMALSPDGSRIWLTDSNNRLVEVDPETLVAVNYHQTPFGMVQNIGGVLPVSSNGRLWLPGGAHYFDLRTRAFGTLDATLPFNIDFGGYHGTLDGSLVLISPSYLFTPLPPYFVYEPVTGQLSNPMGNTELAYEPRLSTDGSRILQEFTGRLYNRFFNLLGQVPQPTGVDQHLLMTLTPDGNKILVLRQTNTTKAIDVYSTTAFAPGTTDFAKTGSIAITTEASICNANFDDCHYGNLYLLPSVDSRTLFWIGNQNMQVFSIP